MKLILIRHPETKANAQRLIYGHSDWGYSEVGEAASDKAAEYIRACFLGHELKEPVKVYATPLKRTRMLAEKIVSGTNLEIKILDHLIELNVGIFENMTIEEAKEKYEEEWEAFSSKEVDYRIPEGESWTDVYRRVEPFIDEINGMEGTVILVSHAMVIRSLLAHIMEIELSKTWHFNVEPSGIIEIDFYKGFGMIRKMIDFHKK